MKKMEETKPTILFNKKRAHEYFSEGVITAMGGGGVDCGCAAHHTSFFCKNAACFAGNNYLFQSVLQNNCVLSHAGAFKLPT